MSHNKGPDHEVKSRSLTGTWPQFSMFIWMIAVTHPRLTKIWRIMTSSRHVIWLLRNLDPDLDASPILDIYQENNVDDTSIFDLYPDGHVNTLALDTCFNVKSYLSVWALDTKDNMEQPIPQFRKKPMCWDPLNRRSIQSIPSTLSHLRFIHDLVIKYHIKRFGWKCHMTFAHAPSDNKFKGRDFQQGL